ncbi:MAG TPA: GNAT family N-acetyltransferase [Micromonosporaceae bacterium]|nr:GNAT family N-acetyltransferase [Micromonosporaceae bacterium]
MTDGELPIRAGRDGDWGPVDALLTRAFLGPMDKDLHEIEAGTFEPERALIVEDDGDVVGTAAAFTREMTVPGAVLPAAHVTMVSVASTHRRRGLLTRMMHRQLREVRDAGAEPFATLWASEGRIYPRFGYGLASQQLSFEIDTREAVLQEGWQRPADAAGRLRDGEPGTLLKDMQAVYERLRPQRPGWSSRNDAWWRYVLADSEARREGASPRRAAVLYGPDGPTGYAFWRTKRGWTNGPNGEVHLGELVAEDPASYTALWRFVLSIDLVRSVRFHFGSLDEPLLHLVAEISRLGGKMWPGLWVRLVDLGAALAGRRYATPVDVVFDVTDPLLPENAGRWRLTGDRDGAACAPTTATPDLACDVRELGAAYLGGTSLGQLAAAGRVEELRPGALLAADAAFGWHRAPGGIEIF